MTCKKIRYDAIPFNMIYYRLKAHKKTMQYHTYHAIQWKAMQYHEIHAIPYKTIQHNSISLNNVQSAMQYNIMQHHSIQCTTVQ